METRKWEGKTYSENKNKREGMGQRNGIKEIQERNAMEEKGREWNKGYERMEWNGMRQKDGNGRASK